MKVLTLETGLLSVNCYVICCEDTGVCSVIDPGGNLDDIMQIIQAHHLHPESILLTHGHFDHIGAVKGLREQTGAKVAIHEEDSAHLTDFYRNLSFSMGLEITQCPPDTLLKGGDTIQIGSLRLTVLHTPGHTNGSVTYMGEGVLFTGDTLFQGSIGRTDLLGGDHTKLLRSIKERLWLLKGEYRVYPGHGAITSLDRERRTNPFLRGL